MNLINHKNGENLAFMRSLQFLPNFKLLYNQNQDKFRKSQHFSKFLSTLGCVFFAFSQVFVHSRSLFSHLFAQGPSK